MQYEIVLFEKTECLVKTVKKCFLKKLSVWLALIKVMVWLVNYQKEQCIYKGVYFIFISTTSQYLLKKKKKLLNNNNNNKYIIVIIICYYYYYY